MNIIDKLRNTITALLYFPLENINDKRWQIGSTIGLVTFCSVFLYIFMPFNINYWINETEIFPHYSIYGICIGGGITLLFSHIIIYFLYKNRQRLYVYHLLIACLWDIICLSLALGYLYHTHPNNYWLDLYETSLITMPILVLAYFLLGLLFIIQELKKQQEPQAAISSTPILQPTSELICIYDANQEIRLQLEKKDLLYIEAADNYITVFFLKDGHLSKELIRNTLKKAEESLSSKGFIKCHRSYLINQSAIQGWKKGGRNYKLLLKHTNQTIPVSRSYIPTIIKDEPLVPKTAISPQEAED